MDPFILPWYKRLFKSLKYYCEMIYKITRMKRDRSEKKVLSNFKFVSLKAKKFTIFTEKEADEYIKKLSVSEKYYFFKSIV